MFLRYIIICCVFISSTITAVTIKTIATGDWENPAIWSNNQVPVSPDSILIYHYVTLNHDLTINNPTVLFIDTLGTICGEYLLETLCGSSFVNYGHLFLNQIKTRAGLNYFYISCKNYMIISGCSPGGGYYNNLPPNGSTYVWPPVLCKTQNTNWEGGGQIGIIELENNILKIYPNPITNEPLTIITLSKTKMKLMDVTGNEILGNVFENKTELHINSLPDGVYFLELEINGNKQIKKILKSD
jgi:hypothetical protein